MPFGEYAALAADVLASPEAAADPSAAFDKLMAAAGLADGAMPERWAPINEILNALTRKFGNSPWPSFSTTFFE